MIVHVLDTGALYNLANKKHSPLWGERLELGPFDVVIVPAIVIAEANQARVLSNKFMDKLRQITDEGAAPIEERHAKMAASRLRSVTRVRCALCSDLGRPSLVDALVMAFAVDQITEDPATRVVVHTSDCTDFERLRDGDNLFSKVTVSDVNDP